MLDVKQFYENVLKPTLANLGYGGLAAERLILGTILQESNLTYVRQLNNGPARGFIQMEKATHKDIWDNYLNYKRPLIEKLAGLMVDGIDPFEQLMGNNYYAIAMCRIFYLRVREALPAANDIEGMANYWKKYYNTHLGKGKPEEFLRYKDTILDVVRG